MQTLFRTRAFGQLWLSTVAATAAQGIERTLTAWLALQLGADPLAIGVIFAARTLPSLLLGLPAGALADRLDRPRQLGAAGMVAALQVCLFAWLAASGAAQVWHVALFTFALGCAMVFDTPARQALVLDVVPGAAAQRALALNALAGRLASALGALLGGALVAGAGLLAGLLVAALCYAAAALLAAPLRVAQSHRGQAAQPFGRALADSLRMVAQTPAVLTLIVVGLVCEVFAFSHHSGIPLFAERVLAAGPAGLGALNAAQSIGAAIGVALLSLLPERVARKPLLAAVYLLYGVAIVSFALSRDLALAAAALVLTGMCAAAFDVLQQTLIQLAVPPEQRGRAVGLWVLSIGSAPLGHLEMGALAAAIGPAAALLINGALTSVAALWLLVRQPAYRWWGRSRAP